MTKLGNFLLKISFFSSSNFPLLVSVGSGVGYGGGAYEIDIDQLYKLSEQEAYCICRSY